MQPGQVGCLGCMVMAEGSAVAGIVGGIRGDGRFDLWRVAQTASCERSQYLELISAWRGLKLSFALLEKCCARFVSTLELPLVVVFDEMLNMLEGVHQPRLRLSLDVRRHEAELA